MNLKKYMPSKKKEIVTNLKDDPNKNPYNEMKWLEIMQESLTAFTKSLWQKLVKMHKKI